MIEDYKEDLTNENPKEDIITVEPEEDTIVNDLLEIQEDLHCKRTPILEIAYDRVGDVDNFRTRIMVLDHTTATWKFELKNLSDDVNATM